MGDEEKKAAWGANVSAELLLAVAPHRSGPERDDRTAGILIEPHPEHGVLLIATDGVTLGVAWDREGQASAPMTVSMPPSLLDACRRPTVPTVRDEGEDVTPAMPPWMVPCRVLFTRRDCLVTPAANPRGVSSSYLFETEIDLFDVQEPLPWRTVVPTGQPRSVSRFWIDPAMLARFEPVSAMARWGLELLCYEPPVERRWPPLPPVFVVRPRGPTPDFFGMILPMEPNDIERDALPDWLGVKEAATAGQEAAP